MKRRDRMKPFQLLSIRGSQIQVGFYLAILMACFGSLQAGGIIGHHPNLGTKNKAASLQSRRLSSTDATGTQGPDTLEMGTGKPALPKNLAPIPVDNLV
jgi:hypothetical protein